MDTISVLALLCFSILFFYNFFSKNTKKNLPPSPPSLPILGHLHLLKKPIHRTLASLSDLYGPILLLRFGSRPVLIVTSVSVAEECLTTHDIPFANRPRLLAGKFLGYDFTNIVWASYGPHWRNLRRILSVEILSSHRLQGFFSVRMEEVKSLVGNLHGNIQGQSPSFKRVELKSMFFVLVFNTIMRMVTGKRSDEDEVKNRENATDFRKTVEDTFAVSGATNIRDYLPVPRWIGFLGLEKKMMDLRDRRDSFLQTLIDHHRRKRDVDGREWKSDEEKKEKTMIDLLLSLQDEDSEYYTNDVIKGIIMALISAGSDTSTVTIEWAMALLLNHPEALKTARTEIDAQIKPDRLVEETDLANLPYLRAIINETLRLYPAGPLLVAHESSEDIVVGGFDVSKGTMLLINAWAIHRDEKMWKDPNKFKPERFLKEYGEADQEGSTSTKLMMLPFGLGRRRCPGEALAMKVVGLTLAALIQCFEWEKVDDGVDLDMTEGGGLTMPKAVPLEALCKTRSSMVALLSQL